MKTNLYRHCCIAMLLLFATGSHAQLTLVENGKPVSRIIADTLPAPNARAATLLQDFINRISGATLPILPVQTPQKGDIVIEQGNTDGLTEDGFRLETDKGILYISSGGDKGVIYGVVTLLEDYLEVAYFNLNTCTFEERKDVSIPVINRTENPAFRYRQTQSYAAW
ncbi:MAG: glycoside hydrolase family 20 zincin-like fold domain-containing protein [Tannerellaceae bacterium]|nr:glycoside hydrolase family 20 zincin-like fold domain-containing protein [Tannerellaceae bacterium]MCD8265249.1 glycoside hydrolase family 20 zincin-like fold domain-containing protein [Tannerellaceae bacterium]